MTAYFLSIVGGVLAGLIGIGYRIGSKGKVFPIQRVFLASVKKEGKHQKQFKVFQYIHEYV